MTQSAHQLVRFRLPAILTAALAVAGCASSATVQVKSQFPTPVVEPLPLRAAVYYPVELRNFQHEESIPQHSSWQFDVGEASVSLFQPLFDAMFQQVVLLEQLPPGPDSPAHDLIVSPILERFEFDIPRSRDAKFVEVWMLYRLYVYEPDGTLIAEWPVTGYGKSPASGSLPRNSLHDATVRAMREAGATIAVKFATQPNVRAWLQEKQHEQGTVSRG